MATKLNLAAWSRVSQRSAESAYQASKVRGLKPALVAPAVMPRKETISILALLFVVVAHAAAFVLLMTNTTAQSPPEKPATPMMVSLVSNPQPAPEAAPEPQVAPPEPKAEPTPKAKPVVKKQKPLPEVAKPTPQPKHDSAPPPKMAAPEPTPVQEAAPAPQSAKVADAVDKAPSSEVAEPQVEPPKFGAAYLNNPAPAYPTLSRRMGEEGRVTLRVLVTANGDAGNVQIETGSGFERLDQAALDSVKKWRFIPAKKNNQPVSAYVLVPVKFSLNS